MTEQRPTGNKETARTTALIGRLFDRMLAAAGARHWWPCDPDQVRCGRDEMIIGAMLTQNTAWVNVERALASLKAAGLCDLEQLAVMPAESIAPLIRSAGYFNLKARRLKSAAEFFAPGGSERFEELATWDDERLRAALLGVWGVGRETADSILLYALGRLSFVIDAYTQRIGTRHGLFGAGTDYETARACFSQRAQPTVAHYNEYHALLVWIGNHYCRPTPRCAECPLATRDCFASAPAWRALAALRIKKS